MKTHDLTNGWMLTILDNGAMAIQCADPKVQGVALNPEQAARLKAIVLDRADAPTATGVDHIRHPDRMPC